MKASQIKQDREGIAFERKCGLIKVIEIRLELEAYSLAGLLTVNIRQLERLHDKIMEKVK